MVGNSDAMKKREKLLSKGQQDTHEQDMQGMDVELKGAESERERSTKRPGTGA